jgi:hypothetical protein
LTRNKCGGISVDTKQCRSRQRLESLLPDHIAKLRQNGALNRHVVTAGLVARLPCFYTCRVESRETLPREFRLHLGLRASKPPHLGEPMWRQCNIESRGKPPDGILHVCR